jgi:RimJ/RimL family protein N-acetyltransferase
MKLASVYAIKDAPVYLYALLTERESDTNISHQRMPTVEEHLAFVKSKPYTAWYLLRVGRAYVGSIYLTRLNEVGIFIFKAHQGNHYGPRAVRMLRERHHCPRLLANINPRNKRSVALFERLGGKLIQCTYQL